MDTARTLTQVNRDYGCHCYIEESSTKPKSNPVTTFFFYFVLIAFVLAVFVFAKPGSGFFGYSYRSILTGSMRSEMPPGTLVLTKFMKNPAEIRVGDDITFFMNETKIVTHRVIAVHENYDDSGLTGFETQGIDNEKPDKEIVYEGNVIGKVIWHVRYVGAILQTIADQWLYVAGGILLLFSIIYLLGIVFIKEKPQRQTE